LSTFVIFEKIMSDKTIVNDKSYNSLRKFCYQMVGLFFEQVQTNPFKSKIITIYKKKKKCKVLFCEVLFLKPRGVIEDINTPGALRQRRETKKALGELKKEGVQMEGNVGDWHESEDEEASYQVLDMKDWTPEEDQLLRTQFPIYESQPNCPQILQKLLFQEFHLERQICEVDSLVCTLCMCVCVCVYLFQHIGKKTEKVTKEKDKRNTTQINHIWLYSQSNEKEEEEEEEEDGNMNTKRRSAFEWLRQTLCHISE
ncbi:hypothetical protein RFI_19425, partial [Reticulomyxa filosa]